MKVLEFIYNNMFLILMWLSFFASIFLEKGTLIEFEASLAFWIFFTAHFLEQKLKNR